MYNHGHGCEGHRRSESEAAFAEAVEREANVPSNEWLAVAELVSLDARRETPDHDPTVPLLAFRKLRFLLFHFAARTEPRDLSGFDRMFFSSVGACRAAGPPQELPSVYASLDEWISRMGVLT